MHGTFKRQREKSFRIHLRRILRYILLRKWCVNLRVINITWN